MHRLGLERTEGLRGQASAAQAHLCLYRLKILDLRDRVLTYRAIVGSSSSGSGTTARTSSETWQAFQKRPIIEIAEDVASEGNVRALAQVIRNHPFVMGPATVAGLLRLLPETISTSSYQHLLPGMGPSSLNARPLDWVEEGRSPPWQGFWTPQVRKLSLSDNYTSQFSNVLQLYMQALEQWYVEKAEEIESRGGALAAAAELVSVGLSRGVPGGGRLENLRAELWHMSHLLYGGVSLDPRCVYMLHDVSTALCRLSS